MSPEETKDRVKDRLVQAMMKGRDAKRWRPMLDMLGIRDEDSIERMTRILLLHLMLDRALTALLTLQFLNQRLLAPFDKIEAAVAPVSISKRIELAKAAHLISATCAGGIKTVNKVRNQLAHYQPQLGPGVGHVIEISSAKAYEQCIDKGFFALREIIDTMSQDMEKHSPTE